MQKARKILLSIAALAAGTALGEPPVEEALVTSARSVMPGDLGDSEVRAMLESGVWREEPRAVALSIPRGAEYMTFVFRRQADGSYSAADASWVANTAFGFWGFPRDEIERFETEPLSWHLNDDGHLHVLIQTKGWREGQRYTARGYFLVAPDGTVSGQ